MYLKFFRETENNVPEMFAPHLTLLSGFIGGGGYDVSEKCAAFEQLKQKEKKIRS